MIKRIEVIITVGIIALLLMICFIAVAMSDKEGPVITIDDKVSVTYMEGQDESTLLQGVKAHDKRDGDVTSSLVVESTIIKDNVIKVRYAAKDKSNNVTVAKEYREIPYTPATGSIVAEQQAAQDTAQAGQDVQNPEQTQGQEILQADAQISDDVNKEETTMAEETQASVIDRAASDATGIPAIRLAQSEVTIDAGEAFEPLSMVTETYDASGDVSRRIQVYGEYNRKKAGDYQLTYYVTNPMGVQSQPAILTLHVR